MLPSLPKQFAISQNPAPLFDGWKRTPLGRLIVHTAPELPVTRVIMGDDRRALILGWFVQDGQFHCSAGTWNLSRDTHIPSDYGDLCGRFVVLEETSNGEQITSDPAGLLPVIFDEERGVFASTPAVVSRYRTIEEDVRIRREAERPDGRIWYPFGLVPFRGIRRILPGRTVSSTGDPICRPGYAAGQPAGAETPEQLTKSIMRRVSSHVAAVAAGGQLTSHLTAGYDSRMVLAACLYAGLLPDLVTIVGTDRGSRLDASIAGRLAELVGADHRTIRFAPPSQEEMAEWMERTSHCVRDSVTSLCRTVRENDDGRFSLTGTCGEVGRGFYWQRRDLTREGFEPDELVVRMGFRPSPGLLRRARHWLDRFPPTAAATRILDEAYIDHRLGGWAGPTVFGHDIEKPTLSPFNGARVFEQMMALPADYRLDRSFVRDFVSLGSPRLLELPFNRATGCLRIRYWREEIKRLAPENSMTMLRRLRM